MKKQIRYILLVLCLSLLYKMGVSQENYASNISKSISDNEKLLLTYDIKANDGSKSFSVILMLTHNGTKIEGSSVYGDVGSNIEPGTEKAIVWYFKNDFDGNINDVSVDIYAYKENEPQAIFKLLSISNNGYAPCKIVFSNSSSYANEYQWDFGDPSSGAGNLSFEKDPSHTFENGGIFSIALIARNTQLKLENTYYQSVEIKVHEKTTADFQIDGNNQLPPAKVKFRSTSVNADTYQWNFGDPASKKKNESDKKDVEHKYGRAGTYTVELLVKNNFSNISDKISKEVIVEKEKLPVAQFTFSKSSETAPSTVVFKNTSESSDNYKWEFGDPTSGNKNSSTDINPAHVFTKAGNYNIVLNAFAKGVKKPTKYSETITIKELPKPPLAGFTIQNNNVLGPATIIFTNNSTNATSYIWDFGDPDSGNNNVSDKKAPTHTYKNAGRYKVVLTATSPNFNETSTVSDFAIITDPSKPPLAKFNIGNNNSNSPVVISFYNESLYADNYLWDFGDPASGKNTSTEQSPKHRYANAGRYKVVLTASNKKTGEKSISSDFVIVNETVKAVVLPEANFSIENNNTPSPAIISFTNKSVDAHSYSWDFGDPGSEENISVIKNPTHVYSTAGRYMVTLTAKNENSGQTKTFTEFVVVTEPAKPAIRPVAKFSSENNGSIAPVRINFTNTSVDADTYVWDFGAPGSENNVSTESNPSHLYEKAGRYKVELTVTNNTSGLSNSFSDFITVAAQILKPEALFEIKNNNAVEPATISFKNTSVNANSFAWDFGDPVSGTLNTSISENPQHVYAKAGEYKVVLAVLNKKSGEEAEITKTVKVAKPVLPPSANFEITFNGEFVPINIQFKNLSTNADLFEWNFGDFNADVNSSKDKTPNHNYTQSGKYKITLKAVNTKTGETSEISKEISLKSNFKTFAKHGNDLGENERAISFVQSSSDEYLVLLNNKENSSVLKLNNLGDIIGEEELNNPIHHIISTNGGNKYLMLGLNLPGDILVQSINTELKMGNPVLLSEDKNFKYDYGTPKFALNKTNEVGIIANTINDKYPLSILFEKTDKLGRIIPLTDRTFKYIGTKLATDIIPIEDGGFAITGFWKEKEEDNSLVLFGKIDSKGKGEMHLIRSYMNSIGCDIKQSFNDGYAILRAQENVDNSNLYDLSFIIVDSEGGPTDCANELPCIIKKEDILNYEPAMIKTKDGFIIASHAFNGVDYNIRLFWIDKSGNNLIKYQDLNLTNNQFVMDFKQTNDGGLIIVGTERANGKQSAFIVKTDPYGKLNPKN